LAFLDRRSEKRNGLARSSYMVGRIAKSQVAHGVDGLQALTNAAAAIRRWLDEMSNVSSDDDTSYEVVFPRYVPFCYGLEFHRRLCSLLNEEIKKKEEELSRRRKLPKKRAQDP
jgi:hypothetical protein